MFVELEDELCSCGAPKSLIHKMLSGWGGDGEIVPYFDPCLALKSVLFASTNV